MTIAPLCLSLAAASLAALCACNQPARPSAPPAASQDAQQVGTPSSDCPSNISNWTLCERYKEASLLRATGTATRSGAVLILRTRTGEAVFEDNRSEDPEKVAVYSFARVYAGAPYALVSVGLWEGTSHLLVNLDTGAQTTLPGDALLSPDHRRFAVWSADEAYDGVSLQTWLVSGRGLKVEQTIALGESEAPAEVHWDDRGRLCYRPVVLDKPAAAMKCLPMP